jgi:integral membrane protein (TIGR01906 family)
MNSRLLSVQSWFVTLLIPVALILLSVRVLLTPFFLEIEYRTPGFPPDTNGFTQADRLHWSKLAVEYLVNRSDITFLGNLRFTDGNPVYNERELAHMLDVKNLVQIVLKVWYVIIGVLFLVGIWAWRGKWVLDYRRGLSHGGCLSVCLVGVIALLAAVSFWNFFVIFHKIFFESDTWLFLYSDTLIRLFPLRFWQDTFLWVGGMTLVGGLALCFGLKPVKK